MTQRSWFFHFAGSLGLCAALCLGGPSGCASIPMTAVVGGVEVPRLTHEYTGQPYFIRHRGAHPQPGGASSGLVDTGGNITGQICGMDIDYEVHHRGDHVQMVGFLDMSIPAQIKVEDKDGERHITGNIGNAVVDLHVRSNEMVGTSAFRHFKLDQDGGRLIGKMRAVNTDYLSDVTVNGRDALWALSPAAQGAIVPTLLSCFIAKIGLFGRSPLTVGFGGRGGAQPRNSSSLYQR